MTVTLITAPGTLGSRFTPLVFTCDQPVSSISIEFLPDAGTGPRETVYDGTDDTHLHGSFSWAYRFSTRVGDQWSIVRENGWPAKMRAAIKEASNTPGAGISSRAALTPTVYSPIGQWALQGFPDTARGYLDRSGNSRHLNVGVASAGTDLIPGQTAARCVAGNRLQRTTVTAALQVLGEFTLTGRVNRDAGGAGIFATVSSYYDGTLPNGTLFELGINAAGLFVYSCSPTATTYLSQQSTILAVPSASWSWISLRRHSDGHVTWGIGTTYEDSGAIALPTGCSNAFVQIGDDADTAGLVFGGLIADVSLWNFALTDAQLLPLAVAALGI